MTIGQIDIAVYCLCSGDRFKNTVVTHIQVADIPVALQGNSSGIYIHQCSIFQSQYRIAVHKINTNSFFRAYNVNS